MFCTELPHYDYAQIFMYYLELFCVFIQSTKLKIQQKFYGWSYVRLRGTLTEQRSFYDSFELIPLQDSLKREMDSLA